MPAASLAAAPGAPAAGDCMASASASGGRRSAGSAGVGGVPAAERGSGGAAAARAPPRSTRASSSSGTHTLGGTLAAPSREVKALSRGHSTLWSGQAALWQAGEQ